MTSSKGSEKNLYPLVLEALRKIFVKKSFNRRPVHLEVTADSTFSNKIKEAIPQGREIIFAFLRSSRPDITGFVDTPFVGLQFLVAEVKSNELTLEDVYQVKRYADLFDAGYALLISNHQIPAELKRLSAVVPTLLVAAKGSLSPIRLGEFSDFEKPFVEWFPKPP